MCKMKKLKTVGLFVGCGGLDYGFKKAGFDLVWGNEINNDAAISYEKLTGHSAVVGDIWDLIDSVPTCDVIIGGPPCQAFSLVGKRLADDPRATLVFAYQKIIEKIKPSVFVMENVPGLMSSKINKEKLPDFLMSEFSRIGYNVSLHKICATDFCVPQKRKRVFMIGFLNKNESFSLLDSEKFSQLINFSDHFVNVKDALGDLPSPLDKGDYSSINYNDYKVNDYISLIRDGAKHTYLHSMPTMSEKDRMFVKYIPPGGNYMSIPDDIATQRILNFKKTGGRTTCYGRLDPKKPAYTINTYFNRPNVGANYHYSEERLITVREAMRLQSFPDTFTPFFSNQRSLHAQIGNAVPPLMARGVAESIKEFLGK